MKTFQTSGFVGVFAALAVACGGVVTGASGEGGTAGADNGGTAGKGGSGQRDASFHADGPTSTRDATLPPLDAALGSLDAAPAGLAGFGFIVNDVVQHPWPCSGDGVNWEFPPYPGTAAPPAQPDGCGSATCTSCECPSIKSVILVNTGSADMPYIAGAAWAQGETHYVPGVAPTGFFAGNYDVGVLLPGAFVNITSVYNADIVAVLGSSEPFSSPDSGLSMDEGTIPWPSGVAGSGGATMMYVVEIQVLSACGPVLNPVW